MPAKTETKYTTVIANRGRRVHAVSLTKPRETACGRQFSGWKLAPARLNCRQCKLAILRDLMRSSR
jgi:hypothetical protein